jgi:hypothetical protein
MSEEVIVFNRSLKFFLRSFTDHFPEVKEFKLLMPTYKMLKTVNKKRPYRLFYKMIENCQDAILAKDEDYFRTHAIECPESVLENIAKAVADRWMSMDRETKEVIWQHLAVLVLNARECKAKDTKDI